MQLYESSKDYLYNLETSSPSEAKKLWKRSIKEKWEHKCAYCLGEGNLTIDHIIPRSKGGTDHITNVVCACESCNKDKSHEDWELWYKRQEFFSIDQYNQINMWRTQLSKQELMVYKPRKNFIL